MIGGYKASQIISDMSIAPAQLKAYIFSDQQEKVLEADASRMPQESCIQPFIGTDKQPTSKDKAWIRKSSITSEFIDLLSWLSRSCQAFQP